ncbi:MAG: 2Fe-2S iron-sulfur cluster-binding protein [Chitinophagaceae bacterium]
MVLKTSSIHFKGLYEGQSYSLDSYSNEYRNLMVLLKDKICPDDFGQCGGQGRCGTCLVKVLGLKADPFEVYRNEKSTIAKMGIVDPEIRLSCQILVNEDLKNVTVELIDNI